MTGAKNARTAADVALEQYWWAAAEYGGSMDISRAWEAAITLYEQTYIAQGCHG